MITKNDENSQIDPTRKLFKLFYYLFILVPNQFGGYHWVDVDPQNSNEYMEIRNNATLGLN